MRKDEFNKKASQLLRIISLGGHDVHIVEGDNHKSLVLLKKAYEEVYIPAIPMEEERQPLSSWLDSFKDSQRTSEITISLLGDNLDKPNPTIKAMTVGYYLTDYNIGELAYIVTAPQYQGKGLGRSLNEANNLALIEFAKNKGKQLQGIFFEVNDPTKIKPEEDTMDPTKRIEMYKKWGAAIIPIDYVQPPLKMNSKKCETLRLMAYRHPETGQYPTKNAIKSYLTGSYTELERYAGCPPEKNPDYIKSIEQLEKLDLEAFYKSLDAGKTSPKTPKPPPQRPNL